MDAAEDSVHSAIPHWILKWKQFLLIFNLKHEHNNFVSNTLQKSNEKITNEEKLNVIPLKSGPMFTDFIAMHCHANSWLTGNIH